MLLFQGYEYFGYDPATYYSTETSGHPQECSYVIDDGNTAAGDEESVTDAHDLPLEIDLDHVTKDDKSTCKTVRRGSDQKQILCK